MKVGGYIAPHQVHTTFQALPRKVPPDHMCHKWPIGRVGLRVQNFALKSQIFFAEQTSADFADYFWRPIMGHRISNFLPKKNRRIIGILCPETVGKKLRTLVYFRCQRNSTTQIVYLTSADFFRRNLVPRPMYASAELIFWFCVVGFC